MGRKGGLKDGNARPASLRREIARKGGKARAASLSPEKRREIARRGAAARWGPRRRLEDVERLNGLKLKVKLAYGAGRLLGKRE